MMDEDSPCRHEGVECELVLQCSEACTCNECIQAVADADSE